MPINVTIMRGWSRWPAGLGPCSYSCTCTVDVFGWRCFLCLSGVCWLLSRWLKGWAFKVSRPCWYCQRDWIRTDSSRRTIARSRWLMGWEDEGMNAYLGLSMEVVWNEIKYQNAHLAIQIKACCQLYKIVAVLDVILETDCDVTWGSNIERKRFQVVKAMLVRADKSTVPRCGNQIRP